MEIPNLTTGLKRKLSEVQKPHPNLSAHILQQVTLLNSLDPDNVRKAVVMITKFAKTVWWKHSFRKEFEDTIVNYKVVPTLVRYLHTPEMVNDGGGDRLIEPYLYHVQKKCAFILGFLAMNQEHQQLIIDAGALPCLVDLLRMHKSSTFCIPAFGLLRRVADTIKYLAFGNPIVKTLVRMEGGIPLLVELLEFKVKKVQIAVGAALGTLAFSNDDNKKQIVECNALPSLVLMLLSEVPGVHQVAVVAIENMVHSSPDMIKEVLLAGALQPVICLLSSGYSESQKLAARILGLFAATDSDCKAHISQRGAIPPLLDMLKHQDAHVQNQSLFALGLLAQDNPHNQAGIGHNGGIETLLNFLNSNEAPLLQQNATYALFCLADNEDIAVDIIKAGGFQKLKDCFGHLQDEPIKYNIAKTVERLQEKMQGRVLIHLMYLMCFAKQDVQICVAIALASLCSPGDSRCIFIDNNGLELLLDSFGSSNVKQKSDASAALHELATKASYILAPKACSSVYLFDTAPPSQTPQIYLGEEYVNNAELSDVTFLVEGRTFYAHRDCLVSSDIFRAMLYGNYMEREAKQVVIPNIKWNVFELMMRYMYTGTVDVNFDVALDLLRVADQYLLDGLRRICEHAIAQGISAKNVLLMYKISEDYNATTLKHACIQFMLRNFDTLKLKTWYCPLLERIVPEIRRFFTTILVKSHPAES